MMNDKYETMRFAELTKGSGDYGSVKMLYKRAFPNEERAPFGLLYSKARQHKADFWAIYDNEKWVGLTYIICHRQLAYIFYIAVDESMRGQGYGTAALVKIRELYAGKKIFLSLEAPEEGTPNYEKRLRRHSFYLNCGLSDLPYKIKEANVIYDIMGTGGTVEPEEYTELISNYLGTLMRHIVDMRIIK